MKAKLASLRDEVLLLLCELLLALIVRIVPDNADGNRLVVAIHLYISNSELVQAEKKKEGA